jgi:hypothetical protein
VSVCFYLDWRCFRLKMHFYWFRPVCPFRHTIESACLSGSGFFLSALFACSNERDWRSPWTFPSNSQLSTWLLVMYCPVLRKRRRSRPHASVTGRSRSQQAYFFFMYSVSIHSLASKSPATKSEYKMEWKTVPAFPSPHTDQLLCQTEKRKELPRATWQNLSY